MIAMPNHLCKTVCSLGQFKVNHLGPTHWVNMDRDDVMYSIIHMKCVKYVDFSEKFQIYLHKSMSESKHANNTFTGFNHNWEYQIKKQKNGSSFILSCFII